MDSINIFLRDLDGCPRYTKEEERALAKRTKAGDQQAREQLILSCAPYAVALSKRRSGRGLQQEDIVQYAMLGLIDAVDRFDPSRGRLTTCVQIHVRKHILRGIANDSYLVRLPCPTFWRQPGTDQAKAEKVREGIASLDSGSIDPEDERSLQADDTTAVVGDAIWLGECRDTLEHAMAAMTDRQRQVIRLRKAGMTLAGVGEQLGLTREGVRQVQMRALKTLRETLGYAGAVA